MRRPSGRFFFFQAEDGIRDLTVTGVQTCALPILGERERGGRLHGGRRARPGRDAQGVPCHGGAARAGAVAAPSGRGAAPRPSTRSEEPRLNSSHSQISYAVFCLKKKKL